jgi:hypothetical protein
MKVIFDNPVLVALATAMAMWIAGWVRTFLAKRIHVQSPEAETIEAIRPAVNALLEANGPMMHGIIAILEAQQGQCNGNVTEALRVNRSAKSKFDEFLVESAKVGV